MTHEVNLILFDILAQVPDFRKDQAKNVFGFSVGCVNMLSKVRQVARSLMPTRPTNRAHPGTDGRTNLAPKGILATRKGQQLDRCGPVILRGGRPFCVSDICRSRGAQCL